MRAPLVTRHTSQRQSSSVQTFNTMFPSMPVTAAVMLSCIACRLLALGVHKLCPSRNPTGRNHSVRDLATWGPWQQRNIMQTSAPYPAMWQFSVAYNCAPVRWCPVPRGGFLNLGIVCILYHPFL
ncbi:hypothetical protein AVEN_183192-1 [Araneus ventricosus]|uniref:Uncharacterized protein n=1 Tax=Araneus ventricosus TaxID=182803 RepID=A0A4Y2J4K3_ARAVE|nr:hypothetical protein AVEN_183192-1 [Araneus ventricosus]